MSELSPIEIVEIVILIMISPFYVKAFVDIFVIGQGFQKRYKIIIEVALIILAVLETVRCVINH
ncbi:MAG: hypothetical protein IJR70_06120 [Eubacterium sp.]|nr:hypothetical protein [Eubacterium sp.]